MDITPLEIRRQEFSRQIRGFDVEEVRTFLESVSNAFERLRADRQECARRVEFLEAKLKEYQDMESGLQEAVINAQKAGRVAEEDSSKRGEELLQSARLEADRITREAHQRRNKLLEDIERLERQRRSFLLMMKQILRGQVELLEVLEGEVLSEETDDETRPSGLAPEVPDDEEQDSGS